jgi:hypothetical protein
VRLSLQKLSESSIAHRISLFAVAAAAMYELSEQTTSLQPLTT